MSASGPLEPPLERLLEEADQIMARYLELAEQEFLTFARGLTIASGHGPRVFERVIADFQRECLEDLAPSVQALRDGLMPPMRRWWIERTKKGSKDADLAVILTWLLAFPHRPFYAQVGAGDKGQAAIVKERMTHLLHHNEWLNDHIEIIQWEVRSKKMLRSGQPMAKLDIMAADISGAHGGTPDMLVINELTHVSKWEFIQNLMDNADGVPQGMVIVATNAGFKGSKAAVWRQNAMESSDWQCHVLSRPAPWHNPKSIEDAKKREPSKSRFNRLWWGKWVSGKGDALDEDSIDACFRSKWCRGESLDPESGWNYVAALDLGIHNDHSGFVVLGSHFRFRKVKLAYMRDWDPGEKGTVDLMDVEETVLRVCKHFNVKALLYDPHQAVLMAQRLSRHIPTQAMNFTPSNLQLMCSSLIQSVERRDLLLYDHPGGVLRKDLGKLNIVEKQYGYRLEATRDEEGHADVATALIIALPASIALMKGQFMLDPEDDIVDTNDEELSEHEQAAMPTELREIYDMDAEGELDSFYKQRGRDPFADVL